MNQENDNIYEELERHVDHLKTEAKELNQIAKLLEEETSPSDTRSRNCLEKFAARVKKITDLVQDHDQKVKQLSVDFQREIFEIDREIEQIEDLDDEMIAELNKMTEASNGKRGLLGRIHLLKRFLTHRQKVQA